MADVEFVLSKRGGSILCVNNFIFHKKNAKQDGVEYHYCATHNCKATARVKNGKLTGLLEDHDHPNDQCKIKRLKFLPTILKRVTEDPHARLSKIYRCVLSRFIILCKLFIFFDSIYHKILYVISIAHMNSKHH